MIKVGVVNGLKVTGHTSEISTKYKSNEVNPENNLQLSIDKARAGANYLINELGVAASKIEMQGVGSLQPAAGINSDDPSNQRTVITPTRTQ